MINKKIIKIRKNLDKLDNKLLEIIKKRTKLVDEIVKNKRFKKDIIDKKRILIILKKIKKKSKDKNIDIKIFEDLKDVNKSKLTDEVLLELDFWYKVDMELTAYGDDEFPYSKESLKRLADEHELDYGQLCQLWEQFVVFFKSIESERDRALVRFYKEKKY